MVFTCKKNKLYFFETIKDEKEISYKTNDYYNLQILSVGILNIILEDI